MKRESLIPLLDNKRMITESMLKNKLIDYTGRIKFRTVQRTNYRGVASVNKNSSQVAFVLSFEIRGKNNIFYDLYNKKNELKEFASLNSIISYLKKLDFLSEKSIFGEIYGQERCNEET